jgi:isoaspartyl peptidase/L-asparaginase-like protein (Ntn-hydrolase superfamily)
LEDDELFNAGMVQIQSGKIRMSAAIMDGATVMKI